MASGGNQFQKRGSNFGRSDNVSRTNKHGSSSKALIKDESELEALLDQTKTPLVLILDCIQDPHNLGACLRSANGAGVDAVIIPRDKAAPVTATAVSVSCGGASHTPIFRVTNLARTMESLKKRGIWIAGTSDHLGTQDLYETDLTGPLALVMGSEAKGMRQLTRDKCDYLVSFKMAGFVDCLNVSVATGVCLFEIVRQRKTANA
ncbi:23S rRNA (guanosine(2251)-2'-O)-methyltransferase RlmB [Pontiella sulfatireligans]|uniref:23S rRNA (Guanosine-2'-O-)-methyltransferase RlmB n=1 Tax=Pontiella sulfatireligans TaxID=2750658 RepID=A0A6C2UI66_9BACT|nr:23S rRNA (guanosine(2251)-2'-O)-methyltransferase RlmB [Pontiella sulfatireligans]VGO19024.1 23S rRNA (guanosine-2'-O-)-methyltransferase RlmB [Pontiella sulfatireligans]